MHTVVKRENICTLIGDQHLTDSYSSTLQQNMLKRNTENSQFRSWKNVENQKMFFDQIMIKLGYKCMDDWYNVTAEALYKNGAYGLLSSYYNTSPSAALQSIYPEHNWMLWRFKTVPHGYWSKLMKDRTEITRMVDWLSQQLSIKCLDDWYNIPLGHMRSITIKDLANMLQAMYPQHEWNIRMFGRYKHPVQRLLFHAIQQIFPNQKIEEDYQHPQLMHLSHHKMELDIYIEALKLAIEYQGEQHYRPIYWTTRDFPTQQNLDEEKRRACKRNGITLLEIPYWWDRTREKLAATIYKVRPELVSPPPGVEPIPTTNPSVEANNLQLPLSHGYFWDKMQDVTGWWMSEKMDGVRAYWNGENLLSRYGKPLSCPKWFTSSLPLDLSLDGELWMGPGTTHDNVLKVIKSKTGDWGQIGYYVFDIPTSHDTYEERMKVMETAKLLFPPHVHMVKNTQRNGQQHLHQYLTSVLAAKGEGVMLRKPHIRNEMGYTSSLLKVKQCEDTEVMVLAIVEGGLCCQQYRDMYYNRKINRLNGLECIVKDFNMDNPPPSGSTILVKHNGATSTGVLDSPVFWRRLDADTGSPAPDWRNSSNHKEFFEHFAKVMNISQPNDWYKVTKEDIHKHGGQALLERYYSNSLYKLFPWIFGESVPQGFWETPSNHCSFFAWLMEHLGYKRLRDWYHVSARDIQKNGGDTLLKDYYNGSPLMALQSIYPGHNWELERFKHKPRGFWKEKENHKRFFDLLYTQLRFNCMDDWYNVTAEDIYRNGGGGLLVSYYSHSPALALQTVYPDHKWDIERFTSNMRPSGKNQDHQKIFFDQLFEQLGYQCMDDWYSVTQDTIHKHGGRALLDLYNGSPSVTLQSVYPEHKWELERFKNKPQRFWKNSGNQKNFFDQLYNQLKYNCMDDWYNLTVREIQKNGGGALVINYYNSSPSSALQSVYPEHKWELERFKNKPKSITVAQDALFNSPHQCNLNLKCEIDQM